MVITHSKGKVTAPVTEAYAYERAHYSRKDDIDSDDVPTGARDTADDAVTTHPSAAEVFHSMSEVASCSYKAREVSIIM